MTSLRTLTVVCAVIICGFNMTAVAADSPAADLESGVWQKHEYTFQFLGFTTTYSCDGLASQLKVLLIAAGARADAKSASGACARGYGSPDKLAGAYLTFYSLTPTNAGNANTPIHGMWRSVVFADRSPRQLTLGDCELVEQFRNVVLPLFTTRNVEGRTTCVPHQLSGSAINLKFEVFAEIPATKKRQ
jgi:hypothetical protein